MTRPGADVDQQELLRQLLLEKYEPVAVVGVGLNLPGGNTTLEGLAGFLRDGGDGTGPIPADRWDAAALHSAEPARGKMISASGGFVAGIDQFDPRFFNIAPKEAAYIDPQHRMLLEAAWHALESANIDPAALRGGSGGVYVGVSSMDYAFETDALIPEELDGYLGAGVAHSALSGRVSYFLGWRGPCLSIDTACSSSLVAVHLAAKGLRQGECDIALAGGVNSIHHPFNHVVCSQANMLAPDGRSKTFDERADGYCPGEGVGVLVLKRLSDARRDGNRILALVRGSSVRQDGESGGLTVPNGVAQAAVMRAALQDAALEPGDIGYVEAHGTGTSLGDPIELGAINTVFGASRAGRTPLLVGSVKTNLGHLEAGAGACGLIKAVLQLRDGVVYPHRNVETWSSHIPWDQYPIRVPQACEPWPEGTRRAVVNSFGFAGTIASVVLEQAPPPRPQPEAAHPVPAVLTLSAKTPAALRLQAAGWLADLQSRPEQDLDAFCRTTNVARSHFGLRAAAPVADLAQAQALLRAEAAAQDRPAVPARPATVAFLFTGQGSQYPGMGAAAYRQYPAFRAEVDRLDRLFEPYLGRSIRDLMFGLTPDPELLHQTRFTQCALFVLEYAQARLLLGWGVRPGILLGHSIGEVVAATVAGLFDLPDAVRLVEARSRLMQAVTAPGGMAAVRAPAADVAPLLAGYGDVSLAADNAPNQCVVSGGTASLQQVGEALRERGLDVRPLTVSHAFHSPLMAEVFDAFRAEIAGIAFHEPTVSFVSNLTGRVAEFAEVADPDYWVRLIGEPVAFAAGIRTVAERGRHLFVEVGPGGALTTLGRRSAGSGEHAWIKTMSQGDADGATLRTALAACYTAGLDVDWAAYHRDRPGPLLDLPGYAFDRRRYWLPTAGRPKFRSGSPEGRSGLLGAETTSAGQSAAGVREFRSELGPQQPGYLADHVVMDQVVFPGAGYLDLVLQLQDAVYGETGRPVRELRIHEPLFLPADTVTEVRTRLLAGGAGVEIVSLAPGGNERRHATAQLAERPGDEPGGWADELRSLADRAQPATDRWEAEDLYAELRDKGLSYGPLFQGVRELAAHPGGLAVATVRAVSSPGGGQAPGEVLAPPVLDAVMQTLVAIAPPDRTYLPVGFDEVVLAKKPRGDLRTVLRRIPGPDGELGADILAMEGDRVAFAVRGLRLRAVTNTAAPQRILHELQWLEQSLPSARPDGERQVVMLGRGPAPLPAPPPGVQLHEVPDLPALAAVLEQRPVSDVCWFWSPGPQPAGGDPAGEVAALRADCARNYAGLLALCRAIADLPQPPRLLLVTAGAQLLPADPGQQPAELAAATLWGFAETMRNEHPRLRVTLVDLPAVPGPAELSALLDELSQTGAGDHRVAVRGGARHVQRIRPLVAGGAGSVEARPVVLSAQETYLITGGLGALGQVAAQSLARRGARHLTLVGRSPADAEQLARLRDGLGPGVEVSVLQADVADPADVARLMAAVDAGGRPLGGVLHTAGVLANAPVDSLDPATIETVLRPKMLGGWLLHRATADRPGLRFFVSYSSVASLVGSLGQANYAAGNAFLDALMQHRAGRGLPALSVNWGPWAQAGMAARLTERQISWIEDRGLRYLTPAEGMRQLLRAWDRPSPQLVVGRFDWPRFLAAMPAADGFYAAVRPGQLADPAALDRGLGPGVDPGMDLDRLCALPRDERVTAVEQVLRAKVAALLSFDSADDVDPGAKFLDLGMDSLAAVELKNALEAALRTAVPTSALFDHPVLAELAAHLADQLVAPAAAAAPVPDGELLVAGANA